jgi:hypothetical protein
MARAKSGARISSALKSKAKIVTSTCNTPMWLIYLLAGLCTVALLYIGFKIFRSREEHFDQQKTRWELILLTMKGCTWCEKMLPVWDTYTKAHKQELDQMGVEAKLIEKSDPQHAKYEKHVSGYPTLIMVSREDENVVHKFAGERTPEGITQFVKSHAVGSVTEAYNDDDEIETNVSKLNKKASEGTAQSNGVYEKNKGMSDNAGMDLKQKEKEKFIQKRVRFT